MKLAYIMDTDWAVHYLHGTERFVEKLTRIRLEGLGLSILSLAEIYEGVVYSDNPEQSRRGLDGLIRGIMVVNINPQICEIFGHERGKLRRKGLKVGDFDLIIACTCLHYDVPLLTNNRRHFEMVEGLKIISI